MFEEVRPVVATSDLRRSGDWDARSSVPGAAAHDPLGDDLPTDRPILTSERRLRRLAMVAADVGARFAREGIAHDPAAWMLTPRTLFDGARALDACQDRTHFVRAVLLHGLGLGLDADPGEIDALIAEDDADADEMEGECVPDAGPDPVDGLRLFSVAVDGRVGSCGRSVQAFCATVAAGEEAVRRRVRLRYGEELAEAAVVVEGFDPDGPLARELLAEPVARLLEAAAADPSGSAASGLDVQVERRSAW